MGTPIRYSGFEFQFYPPLVQPEFSANDDTEPLSPIDTGEYERVVVIHDERETQTATQTMVVIEEPAFDDEDTREIPIEVITQEAERYEHRFDDAS